MKPILFVDGYNIIGAWAEAEREGWPLDESRDRLTHLLQDYAGYSGQEVVLVFDGHHSERPIATVETGASLTVVYTRHGQTADQYIERACGALPVYREARVATSDHLEQTMILGRGATRLSARELWRELSQTRSHGRARHAAAPDGRTSLSSALSDEQRRQLEEIRRRK
ncbi:MAG: NYN domain-containing protein [Clostridiales bacterium]|nr:NYN domain-containing protein [Clostridiales bacterium]